MSETPNKISSFVNMGKVFVNEKNELYFIKTTETFQFKGLNADKDEVYGKDAIKTERTHVTPEQLGFTKKATYEIYVYKIEHDDLEEKTVYYSMLLNFEIPNEQRYKTAYFKTAKSGRVSLMWLDSGTCSEVSVNDSEFCKRSKAKRLSEDTILKRGSPIFTLNGNGELERRLEEPW